MLISIKKKNDENLAKINKICWFMLSVGAIELVSVTFGLNQIGGMGYEYFKVL